MQIVKNKKGLAEKIQLVNFKKLKEKDIAPLYNKADIKNEIMLVTIDGRLLVDKSDSISGVLKMALDSIATLPLKDLEQLQKEYAAKYPFVKDAVDIKKVTEKLERLEALILCLIPAEMKRREFEKFYYTNIS